MQLSWSLHAKGDSYIKKESAPLFKFEIPICISSRNSRNASASEVFCQIFSPNISVGLPITEYVLAIPGHITFIRNTISCLPLDLHVTVTTYVYTSLTLQGKYVHHCYVKI